MSEFLCHQGGLPIEVSSGTYRLTSKVIEKKVTLPPAQRAYGPEGTVNSEPVNGYVFMRNEGVCAE
jgi:hypothetical protein